MEEVEIDPAAAAVLRNTDVANILQRLQFLEEQHNHLVAENKKHQKTIVSLQSRLNAPKEPKLNDPEEFKGDRLRLMNFISQCQLKFAGEPSKFTNDRIKILYAGSRLRQEAYSWFQPLLAASETRTPPEFESFKIFCDALTAIYGDPNLEITAERELRHLKQITTVAAYIAEFSRIRQYTSHNDSSLRDQFYYGLRDNVKEKLSGAPRPSTLIELMATATSHDSRIQERILEKRAQNPPATTMPRNSAPHVPPSRTPSTPTVPRATPSQVPLSTADGTLPMQLDAGRFGGRSITPSERERRRVEHLCYYCGQADHNLPNCPRKPQARTFSSYAYPIHPSPPQSVISINVDNQSTNGDARE
jgi:hypothetical protein